ncbi:MAG: TetR/AcrR family transcriptional regulator [Steroidobacteraceae bacterium]
MNYNTLSQPRTSNQHLAHPNPSPSRRNRVLDEAAKELNAHGVSLTSLAEIAAKLGISRAAMYYYVEDRQDLVFQCYRRACEIIAGHLEQAVAAGGNPKEIISRFMTTLLDPNEREIVASAEIGMMREPQRAEVRSGYLPIVERMQGLLELGQREGLFRECDTFVCARSILSMVLWTQLVQRWGSLMLPVSRERVADALRDLVFEGFATAQAGELAYRPIDLTPMRIRVTTSLERDARSDLKREALIGVASRLFNQKGIDSTSLEEIAAQVGATKRTLHRHLGSKQALVDACFQRAFSVFRFVKEQMIAYQGSRLAALCAALHAHSLIYSREDMAVLAPHAGMNSLEPEGKKKLLETSATMSANYTSTMQQGVAEGSVRDGDVEARVVVLAGAFSWLVGDDAPTVPEQREAVACEITTLLALGVARR